MASRDQAARIVRSGPEQAGGEDSAEAAAALADQLRSHVAEESRRRPGDARSSGRRSASGTEAVDVAERWTLDDKTKRPREA